MLISPAGRATSSWCGGEAAGPQSLLAKSPPRGRKMERPMPYQPQQIWAQEELPFALQYSVTHWPRARPWKATEALSGTRQECLDAALRGA